MHTALRATSDTIAAYLTAQFQADSELATFFTGGTMVVSLDSPERMEENTREGLSVWLYRLTRDEETLNLPRERVAPGQLRRIPLPVRPHYLITPITSTSSASAGTETEQVILGKVLQLFHDYPCLHGADLKDELSGTSVELYVRLEPMKLDQMSRVWDALEGSFCYA